MVLDRKANAVHKGFLDTPCRQKACLARVLTMVGLAEQGGVAVTFEEGHGAVTYLYRCEEVPLAPHPQHDDQQRPREVFRWFPALLGLAPDGLECRARRTHEEL